MTYDNRLLPDPDKVFIQSGVDTLWIELPLTNNDSSASSCSQAPPYPEGVNGAVSTLVDGKCLYIYNAYI
jgi:hypothetical protein